MDSQRDGMEHNCYREYAELIAIVNARHFVPVGSATSMGPPLPPPSVSVQQNNPAKRSSVVPNIQLPVGHCLPINSPLIFPALMQNGSGYIPEHQDYQAHREYRSRLAYTAYHGVTGSVEGWLIEGKGMKDILIRVSFTCTTE